MRIWHDGKLSYIQGKESEKEKIDSFVKKAGELSNRFDCFCDESEEGEVCLVWGMEYYTQAERQEFAMHVKKQMK